MEGEGTVEEGGKFLGEDVFGQEIRGAHGGKLPRECGLGSAESVACEDR
jgi:hypothetical protein